MEYYGSFFLKTFGKTLIMVQPPHPWPEPPPRNHSRFHPEGLAGDSADKDSMRLFFCNGLPPKSAAYQIMEATVRDDHVKLKTLLSNPQNLPDFTNDHGVSPLMVAAARGNMMSLEILAAYPLVNLSRQTPDGWTALHYAAHFNKPAVVTSLLKHYTNYTLENKSGEIAFDLADPATQETFWAHKDFTRYMKKLRPSHPRFAPKAPPPVEKETVEVQPPAADRLRLDFVASAARTALIGSKTLRENVVQEIARELPRLSPDEFIACCNTLRREEESNPKAKHGFDWDHLFIETAKSGRADLIVTLANWRDFDEQKTLNEALYQCIRASDAPLAVMTLIQLGANPNAQSPSKFSAGAMDNIIAFKAVESRRPEAFFQICLWTDKLPHWERNKEKIQQTMRMWRGRAFQVNDPVGTLQTQHKITLATEMHDLRRGAHNQSSKNLFAAATQLCDGRHTTSDKETSMQLAAIYAETKKPHINETFSRALGASMMARFLKSGDFILANRMAQDGYHLADAPGEEAHATITAMKRGDFGADIQQHTNAHLDGSLKTYRVKSAEDRMRELKDLALRTPPIYGRGMFGY